MHVIGVFGCACRPASLKHVERAVAIGTDPPVVTFGTIVSSVLPATNTCDVNHDSPCLMNPT